MTRREFSFWLGLLLYGVGEAAVCIARRAWRAMNNESQELMKVRERYTWAANELLACDYGDNEKIPPSIGWRVYGWRSRDGQRRIYGASIDKAIDAEIGMINGVQDLRAKGKCDGGI